ncbi:MAG TPA: HdeD family acid-resistance protein [Acidimicrobiia bacterium]|jgi:uncharacterized membrane protein HdeD (DUF308 family)
MTVDDTGEQATGTDIPAEAGGESADALAIRASLRGAIVGDWWTFVLRGFLAVAFGLAALIWPEITLIALVAVFGAYVLVDGIVAVIFSLGGRGNIRWWTALWGLISVGAGVAVFMWPEITAMALVYLIAAWAFLTGVLEITAAIVWRREMRNEWVLIVSGALSILVGLVLAVFPGEGAISLVWLIGAYAVVVGVLLIVVGFRLRDLRYDLA